MTSRHPHTTGVDLAVLWGGAVMTRRKELGLSRAQLARLTEMTSQAIWQFEKGHRIPLDRTKVVLARAMGTTPGELFEWPPLEQLRDCA